MKLHLPLVLSLVIAFLCQGSTPESEWKHSGSMFILTTPEGANLPVCASLEGFPVLVRLHKDFFDFSQAKPKGDDIRFSSANAEPLAYQIEEWNAQLGVASIWVRIPTIRGNSRQEIKLRWGNTEAKSESNGKAVFNPSNGYLSVWHMDEMVHDEVGTIQSVDKGTTKTEGMIGQARHFPGDKGIFGGDKITGYPTGSKSHTTEAWFRADKPNGRVLAWGNEHGQGKVVMHYRSPPHVKMECYFSGADVENKTPLTSSEWVQVVHSYQKGDSRIYVNGALDGVTKTPNAPLAIKSPARLWIGGWYDHYDFSGDIDEVRISNVVRSPDWIRLQYENQKPHQTLIGPLIQSGNTFAVSSERLIVPEGQSALITAKAGGAQKIYWIVKRDGKETIVGTDRFSFHWNAGRVVGDQTFTLQVKAIFPGEVKTIDIPITIQENIPEPIFTLRAPTEWDGRQTIEVNPQISNLGELKDKGSDKLNFEWKVDDVAVIKQVNPGKLQLNRAQNSGSMKVTATIDNGGQRITKSINIKVNEPRKDAWVQRPPEKDEKPEDNQFIPRDELDEGTLHCNGTLNDPAESVFLRVYANDQLFKTITVQPAADRSYALAAKLKAGLIKYRVEFGSKTENRETILHTASNLVCGDAYLIDGQSNAEATDVGKDDPAFSSEWIRSFGSMAGDPQNARLKRWGNAVVRDRNGGKAQVGYWGMELAKRLVENQKMPICMINGAVGGSRIDQHQRNPLDSTDVATIYGRLLWRVQQARLTHGIRGVLWHQGENDQGADGPTGGFGWETYRQFFIDMAAGWKSDYPNLQHYFVFQIWPRACSMGINGSDNRLREVQRSLPSLFSNLSVMSTLGIKPPGGCHFPMEGYAEFARLICPLVERDIYGKVFPKSTTPPNLKRAFFLSPNRDEIALEFDQDVTWSDRLTHQFYLDGISGLVDSGSAKDGRILLKLKKPTKADTVTYLDSASWNQENLLYGSNGIAALTFCEFPIQSHLPNP